MADLEFLKVYWKQYVLLEKRMLDISEYITIHRRNYAVFSSHFISMYLTICSEIDSVTDEFCKNLGFSEKERYGIKNKISYIREKYKNLKNWTCKTKFPNEEFDIAPFAKFVDNESADWWKVYNNIKHKRTERNGEQYNYELANLKNILHALAALYMLLYKMQKEFYPDCAYACKSDLFEIVIV